MTLPTRPDGGVDWENWLSKSLYGFSQAEVKQAATHERERCAKWHDAEAACLEENLDAKKWHMNAAAAIRKMGD